MRKNTRIFIVGHNDAIENSLGEYFRARGVQVKSNSANGINVLDQSRLERFFKTYQPTHVFLGSVQSGGIAANRKYPGQFAYENLQSQTLLIDASRRFGVKKLLYFSSSCAYPAKARQPIKEDSFLTGGLEQTSEAYATAKIAGTMMCRAYRAQYGMNAIVAVPATLYGPGSDADVESAHVLGALIAKFHKAGREGAKQVVVWGSGRPRREFIFVDDFVSACKCLMVKYNGEGMINIGSGYDVTIRELASMVKEVSGFKGKITFDRSRPDGVMRKLLDNSRMRKLGWKPKVGLLEGIERTYQWVVKRNRQ